MSSMSPYEANVAREIQKWKNSEKSWFGEAVDFVTKPLTVTADFALDNKVGRAFAKALHGIISVINDGATWSVRDDAIFAEYRNNGYHAIQSHCDIFRLDLEQVDGVVGYLGAKYKALALTEGVGAGTLGAAGIALDIPALIALNLRAVGEYATYYGVSLSTEIERQFAMNVLMLGTSPSDAAKQATLAELNRIAIAVAKKKSWKELEKSLIVKGIQEIAKAIGLRLTKAKLAQIVPVVGAAVGGGYNAYYTGNITESARFVYQERFLVTKYGSSALLDA